MPFQGTVPRLHPSVFVAESAQVVGDVEMGQDSSVWFSAVIRGDVNTIRMGERTNIQDHCVLHGTRRKYPVVLEHDITVGHCAILHGCVIHSRCLIGMGAIVLDGAVVEEECLLGAGALVPEGARVPRGSLAVGVPARVRRLLTVEEVAGIQQSARNYVLDGAIYRRGGDHGQD